MPVSDRTTIGTGSMAGFTELLRGSNFIIITLLLWIHLLQYDFTHCILCRLFNSVYDFENSFGSCYIDARHK